MLKLNPSAEPFWLTLTDGARARMKPIDTAAYLMAQSASRDVVRAVPEGEPVGPEVLAAARVAFTRSLVLSGLVDWEGVGDQKGKATPPTPERVDALLQFFPAFEIFEREYAGPLLEAQAEKKGWSPSRGGTSTRKGATPTARAARPAKPARPAAANAPRKGTGRARPKA